VRKFSGTLPAI